MARRRRFGATHLGTLVALGMVALMSPANAQDATTGTTTGTGALRPSAPISSNTVITTSGPTAEKIRKSRRIATQMAKYEFLQQVAEANPQVLAAICMHAGPARILARHRHLDKLADADHYLCRRLTRFRRATDVLIQNPHVDRVIQLDPEGIYIAIARDPGVARILTSHRMFDEMVNQNPDLARVIAQHMR